MRSRTSTVSRKNVTVINITRAKSLISIDFSCTVSKFKILAIPNVLAHGKLYKHDFTKNMTVIKFAQSHTESLVSIDFSCTVLEFQNTGHSHRISPWEVIRA
ncbi:hypothetical protein B296_00009922 [Ensete ventricosum]|uniref:Uncharacterized protein n=1 Tax=Ensete ventricosum TaxID=4639 RepID=A0A426Y2A6_ENSVE|nr:hypothetical protein B296_00009922 [Ensete ventricosum]